VPKDKPQLELRIYLLKLNLPILKTVIRHEGLFDKILNDLTFRYYFQRTVFNAEYYGELIIYTLRRAVANKIDNNIP
jgi:hypothetical protein